MIKNKFDEIWNVIEQETHGCKCLDDSKKEEFKSLFSFENISDNILYNEFNIVFLSYDDYNQFSFLFNEDQILLKVEIPEYSETIVIVRYINDEILNNILR